MLADWDQSRTGALCALIEAMDHMPYRDEFVRQLRSVCAHFQDSLIDVINVPEVPDVPALLAGRGTLSAGRREKYHDSETVGG